MFGACLVNQAVHGAVKPRLTAELAIRLHEQRAVGLVPVTFEIFGNIAGLNIGASCSRLGVLDILHGSNGIGMILWILNPNQIVSVRGNIRLLSRMIWERFCTSSQGRPKTVCNPDGLGLY